MSCTEIYIFGKDGTICGSGKASNAWRGAMAVWSTLERRYLPSLPKPYWAEVTREADRDYWSRTTQMFDVKDPEGMKKIWGLYRDDSPLSRGELIALGSTFDWVLVEASHIDELLKAFRDFQGETNLGEQASAIEKLVAKYPDFTAIGWNQTSVSENQWSTWDEEEDDYISYNCLTGDKHWWLFKDLDSEEKS